MITLSLTEIAQHLGGKLHGEDLSVEHVSSDSRVVCDKTLFVALKGDNFDGHNFVASAVELGAKAVLVERLLPIAVSQIIVENSQRAMGEIGAYVRQRLAPICVALTGSNGKTSVKEMVATILSQQHQVLYTAGNFNNEIGVPLTLLRLQVGDQFGVFELGANHAGEIDYTSSLVKPNVAMVNNVASAHLEGFGSLAGVAKAKAEIFNHVAADGTAIINADDAFATVMLEASKHLAQLTFAIDADAKVKATALQADKGGRYHFNISYADQHKSVALPLAGRHQVLNALAATSICLALGLTLNNICQGLSLLKPVKGRMLPTSLGRVTVIDDSYNANPASVGAAIDWLQKIQGDRCLVLGDLGELGDNAALLHRDLGKEAKTKGVDALFCVGELSEGASVAFGATHYKDIKELVAKLITYINERPGDISILVKGSRSARMERVVEALTMAFGRGEFV
ncbi:UDP-N-acetylmuramoylalanyl-D-glutamyl-2, 6-diaminopimelate--D-alanyl-D-alanine ligase [Shewanella sp. Choline-02u-19]|uniref:UDP-N-acetylmuramoyl-tripeptide--D-alanyl-D- alanine ligase n=1 Tax=unclassified Shewanella TaxID=196818 RepID=UPI000C331664|nr:MULTISPECIES: UDP-N-acetylmuramoyl-tripeptide--D-alanyl-D-alanine ligase [unclassified Shewanella]PKH60594.1 UDP-N-acetylmuramoylalanyl-D-glutamyl-2, 6-diaminopimelate--D-alanyl-D-alanine ligase [Shewanella sp. Bg11-22]PKI30410.1 UDP-N-acetylmuramoylalanyl-D-glutamyl-2, 6-diaminopimelate--D-alanyl-D-alanine ligase [Shewanella sp. Choline-02u-19]